MYGYDNGRNLLRKNQNQAKDEVKGVRSEGVKDRGRRTRGIG